MKKHAVPTTRRHRRPTGLEDVGPKSVQCVEPDISPAHEYAGVPEVISAGEVGARGFEVGLLDEGADPQRFARAILPFRRHRSEVAVSGLGSGGYDAEGHHRAIDGGVPPDTHRPLKRLDVAQHVIGGEDEDDDVSGVVGIAQRGAG